MTFRFEYGDFVVDLMQDTTQCREFDGLLAESGIIQPLPYRCAWLSRQRAGRFLFFSVRAANGAAANGLALTASPSRALPGHVTLLAERFGPSDDGSREAELRALAEYGKRQSRVLRIHLEIFSRDANLRARIARCAHDLGFKRREKPRVYAETVVLDLTPELAEIFSTLHSTARRHIRSVEKHRLLVSPVTDPAYAERMSQLLRETMARTGGSYHQHDWPAIIGFSGEYPGLSRIVGIFRETGSDPESLLAFAWGRNHGDHVDYAVAASTRVADLKAPLGYAAAWDLVSWAKANGATWFDFGGISAGSHASDDPVGGISDFKRYFSKQSETVGEEWVLEPHPVRASIANGVSVTVARSKEFFRLKRFKN